MITFAFIGALICMGAIWYEHREYDSVERCFACGCEIDPDWCWCGDSFETHHPYTSDHSPVEMGCRCSFS